MDIKIIAQNYHYRLWLNSRQPGSLIHSVTEPR